MSRTKNASRNIVAGFLNKMVTLLAPFIIRSIIIKELGSGYLGLNGLFTSVLQVLNLAELGFSSAIVYSMYRPIAENDKKTICALINLYKKIYRIIGLAVLSLGAFILPFLGFLIEGDIPSGINIYVLYSLYLLNTSLSYFLFAYKSAILVAHQRNDIVSNIQTISSIAQYITQVLVIIVFRNYYVFIIIQIISTLINNCLVAIVAKRKYPDYICSGDINIETKKTIRKKVVGLMINKICQTTRNSIDCICISSFLGLNLVAIYSNYYSIIHAFMGIMSILSSSIVASIGNSIVTETVEKNYKDMKYINFIYMWISGWLTICLACLYQPIMELWMGKEYMFSYDIVILFCVYFYALEMGVIRGAYSDAKGLWYENRYRAIIESIANIVLNIVLVGIIGIYGIIIGTLLSLLIINFGYGSQILFDHYFVNQKKSDYFLSHGLYALVTLIIGLITYLLCSVIQLEGVAGLLVKGVICILIPNVMYLCIYCRTKQFSLAKRLAKKIAARR